MVQEVPPIVHLSKTDTAPQLKIENYLTVKGGMRGYRTSRATHGVNSGDYYFECLVQQGPSVDEIKNLLPPNVRLAPKLKQQLQTGENVGGHTRIGWSMRLGDLQAPVGYDKWSYGYRDIQGSRVHNSRREDVWGSEPYGPGDIVGFAICTELNQIHFFRNGEAMGHFVISKGKREGGAAFEDIADGTYYPAISVFLGGTASYPMGSRSSP
jgi:Set1/Ash2 histone methyltransferase complex subunit ASH2